MVFPAEGDKWFKSKKVSEMDEEDTRKLLLQLNSKYRMNVRPEAFELVKPHIDLTESDLIMTIQNPKAVMTKKFTEFITKTTLSQALNNKDIYREYEKKLSKTNIPVLTVTQIDDLDIETQNAPISEVI